MCGDKRIIDALDGKIGQEDDVARLRKQIENGESEDKLHTACEISVAFIRLAQDLKTKIRFLEDEIKTLDSISQILDDFDAK